MKHFALVTNAHKDEALVLTNKIISYIEEQGGTAVSLISNEEQMLDIADIPKNTDCIMVLGGDGSLIRTATKVESLQIPLIGVNLGTLGYLCELEEANVFAAIDQLMQGKYMMEERLMLTGHLSGDKVERFALNDIVIHRMGGLSILHLHVYVNGEFLSSFDVDGMIVATPTGSTGYNMSAGGPIIDPKAKMLLITPINAHNLNSKSIVLGADDVVEIEVDDGKRTSDDTIGVSFDADCVGVLKPGERFVISKANAVTRICKLHKKSFLEILRKKMDTYS
ncbi:MAG: NAD(+)/NADH kinase [Agathobacter sp.]|nr:NAD(+)/NADH kinase [Agathobacter sp.]